MNAYPKTENLFMRDPETHKLTHQLRAPELAQVADWLVTEKVDGTNIRLRYRPGIGYVEILGRSDRASVAGDLLDQLHDTVTVAKFAAFAGSLTLDADEYTTVCVYGEAYGAGIQKGGRYRKDKAVRIFDVTTTREDQTWWRPWAEVERASELLELPTVPVLAGSVWHGQAYKRHTLESLVPIVADGFPSTVAMEDGAADDVAAEGVVARTEPYLYDFRGNRVMFKLKTKDLR